MKHLRLTLLAAMVVLTASLSAFAQSLTIGNATGKQGDVIQLSIGMENDNLAVTSFQCDITLPAGVTVLTDDGDYIAVLSSRKRDHNIAGSMVNGAYRFAAYSMNNRNFTGTSGELFAVPVTLDAVPGEYTITLSHIQLTEGGTYAKVVCDDVSATLTITANEPEPPVVELNFTTWNGTDAAILPSVKYSGDVAKWAYTISYGLDHPMWSNPAAAEYNVIVDVPANDDSDKAWFADDYAMTNDEKASWNYNNTILPEGWYMGDNTPGDIYVRRYFKAEGSLNGKTVYMPAPHDDAPCEYYINGTLVWSRTGFEPGVDGWFLDEVVRLTDEQKALIRTDGSFNVFAYHVHQNWGGIYADGGLYIDGEPKNIFEGDADARTRFAIAIAQYEETAGADPALVARFKADTRANYRQDFLHSLDAVRYELKKLVSPRFEYTAPSAEPADQLEVYIYNVGAGQFLAGGNDWGTRMSLNPNLACRPMVLHALGGNRYAIQTNLPNGLRGQNDWLGHNGYVDVPDHDDWEFEAVGDGSYRIINCANASEGNKFVGMEENERYIVSPWNWTADNAYSYWKLITPAQLEALYAEATAEHPADVTYKIHQNAFMARDFEGNDQEAAHADLNDSKWERNAGAIFEWNGNNVDGDFVFEMYNCKSDDGKVYLRQTIEGLLPGKYVVSCNGYYRDGSWDDAIAGNSNRQLAYLYAGTEDNKVLLKSIFEGQNKGAGYGRFYGDNMIPDWCIHSAKFFQYGQYKNEIEAVVGEDGKLEIGVFRNDADAKDFDWIVVDNFRLEYYGRTAVGPVDPPVVDEDNAMYLNSRDLPKMQRIMLPVYVRNVVPVVSFDCKVIVPEGLTVASHVGGNNNTIYEITHSERCDDTWQLTTQKLPGSDAIKVLCYSSSNYELDGADGPVLYIPLTVDENVEPGTEMKIKITDITLSTNTFESIHPSDVETTFTVINPVSYPGDVNNDGIYNSTDISLTVEYILERDPANGIRSAADVNGDGKINSTDISIIISYILSERSVGSR